MFVFFRFVSEGANGDGMAILSSLRSFDRELQKEYAIPIVIMDNGTPPLTGTSTLTVVIGDINDNQMQPGTKDIIIYKWPESTYTTDTEIGRVYVHDLDDWDLPDKKFYWDGSEPPFFYLNENTGMLTMRSITPKGKYYLRFKVYDSKHTQIGIEANVSVLVQEVTREALDNSATIRITGLSDEDFIRVWDYRSQNIVKSKLEMFKEKIAELLSSHKDKVEIFSVQLKQINPPITDVRFAIKEQTYYKPVRLHGMILMNRNEIERYVGINISMAGINECLYEEEFCKGSCTNVVEERRTLYMVNANRTALVGPHIETYADCSCGARNFSKLENCFTRPCMNNGVCRDSRTGPICTCPEGYTGPRCQQTTVSFNGYGWAWYPAFDTCRDTHISLEFITNTTDGLILYNGPIVSPKPNEKVLSDFLSLEIEGGYPRCLIDFGSGTLELLIRTKRPVNDGEWHRIDLFWDTENVRMVVDFCKTANVTESLDGTVFELDDSTCQARGSIPPYNQYLNVNSPLQIGGIYREEYDSQIFQWR